MRLGREALSVLRRERERAHLRAGLIGDLHLPFLTAVPEPLSEVSDRFTCRDDGLLAGFIEAGQMKALVVYDLFAVPDMEVESRHVNSRGFGGSTTTLRHRLLRFVADGSGVISPPRRHSPMRGGDISLDD